MCFVHILHNIYFFSVSYYLQIHNMRFLYFALILLNSISNSMKSCFQEIIECWNRVFVGYLWFWCLKEWGNFLWNCTLWIHSQKLDRIVINEYTRSFHIIYLYNTGWQTVYENDLYKLLENHGGTDDDRSRVMGAEIALWTENVSNFFF